MASSPGRWTLQMIAIALESLKDIWPSATGQFI